MSRVTERRLSKLEAITTPALGCWHFIYASDGVDFERQRVTLIATGQAKPTDMIFDENEGLAVDRRIIRDSDRLPVTRTHEEWIDILDRGEPA
jgi:hypothetical protein